MKQRKDLAISTRFNCVSWMKRVKLIKEWSHFFHQGLFPAAINCLTTIPFLNRMIKIEDRKVDREIKILSSLEKRIRRMLSPQKEKMTTYMSP